MNTQDEKKTSSFMDNDNGDSIEFNPPVEGT